MNYDYIYKCCIILLLFSISVNAANLYVGGAIGSELFNSPETGLIAGMRYQVYTTATSPNRPIDLRIIALYQTEEELRRFNQPNWLTFTPSIEWASVSLKGSLIKNGPSGVINIGNIVAEYSPYLLWISDDLGSDFPTPKPRGISIEEIKVKNLEFDGLCIWEVLESQDSLNTVGLRINYQTDRHDKNEFIYLNSGFRSASQDDCQTAYSLGLTRKIGHFDVGGIFASERTDMKTKNIFDSHIITDLGDHSFKFVYRNYSDGFNPVYRLATPEFDSQTGKYLGWNPVDKYSGLKGWQILFFDKKTEGKNLYTSFEKYYNYEDGSKLNSATFKVNLPIKSSDLYLRAKTISTNKSISLDISNSIQRTITEVTYKKPIRDNIKIFFNHKKFLEQHSGEIHRKWGLEWNTKNGVYWEAGKRIFPNNRQWFCKVKYTSPNGINFQCNMATPEIKQTRLYNYDDEYNLVEWDNFLRIWVKINI